MKLRLYRKSREQFDSAPKPIDQMWLEMLGRGSQITVNRTNALGVPSVQRGRNMICSIATLPLVQLGPDNNVTRSSLLDQLDPDVPNVVTLAQTVEDLLFDGLSWWMITAQDFAGFPLAVRHLDISNVSLQPPIGVNPSPLPSGVDPREGAVWVDGKPVPFSRVIRFDSPNPGVLHVGGRAIKRAILLDQAAAMYADDPRPLDFFTPGDGAEPLEDDEIQPFLSRWKTARKQRSTAYIPTSVKYNTVNTPSPSELQLVELQRQASLDIANALGVDPEDLGISTTSRTYQNAVDRRRDRINDVLAPYMRAITDTLSMGNVTRRGHRVVFDLDDYMKSNPTERWATYEKALNLGVMTIEEIREKEDMPPLEETAEPEPAPVPPPEADRPASMTFDGPTTFTLDVPVTEFSVDRENRIIEGMAVPYGQYGTKGGITFRFDRNALQWTPDSPGRVKLMFPRHGDAVGKAIQLKNTAGGLFTRFKVGRGDEGDRALQSAEDGIFDGLSVGIDFDPSADAAPDPKRKDALLVRRADLRHVALTDQPVFDEARVTRVAASRTTQGGPMGAETTEPATAPDTNASPAPVAQPAEPTETGLTAHNFTADEVLAILARYGQTPPTDIERQIVDPTRRTNVTNVQEPVPYRFDRGGNFVPGQEFVFSADLHEMSLAGDAYGDKTDAGKRVMGLLQATFDVQTGDVNELNPTIQRPDMYVDERAFKYPIWTAINKGAPPNGVQPFTFPKFSSAAGLVGDHVEGTEPSTGSFVTTGQTVTPSALSGKASINREVWDMGGNPAVSTLIFNQMVKGYREGLESAAATFLNTLTAADNITLTTAAEDTALSDSWTSGLVGLQFVRGYDFEVFVVEQRLFTAFAEAVDESGGTGIGRPLFPMINPSNANGTARSRFTALDLGGVIAIPSWALPSATGDPNNSWLFDPSTVHGWATVPQRLEFPGTNATGGYAPVAVVDLAIWGYKALANSDIGGVRQVIYDPVS